MRSATVRERFWKYVRKADGCWEWTGSTTSNGYGQLRTSTRASESAMRRAHRVSWELHVGPVPSDLCVLHRCDNRRCVRPDHLFLGTKSDNTRDCAAKGRMAAQRDPRLVRGERNPRARLTVSDVLAIRRRARDGATYAALAREYGLSESGIASAAKGRTWKEIF